MKINCYSNEPAHYCYHCRRYVGRLNLWCRVLSALGIYTHGA